MDAERASKDQSHSTIDGQREPFYDPDRASLLREAILDSLAPALINDREGQIVESYSKTFEWIFDPEQHEFARWLSDTISDQPGKGEGGLQPKSDSIFWISGSPGSGKSTLMRHIHQSPKLLRLLRQWAKGKEVTIATFFFWESGTVMQRSRGGLLRSLVYQILTQYPEILPTVMPDLWSYIWTASTVERVRLLAAWDEEELESTLVRYFKTPGRPPTYLHIDGLDELEGDQRQLIGLIERVSTCGDIRICVSSRPWDVFAESFHHVQSLRLQDLTKSDMRRFVRGRLSSQSQIAKLLSEHSDEGHQIEGMLLEKAAGVFLWVSLAVADISQSIHSGIVYTIGDLYKHADMLPQGLDNFYQYRLIDHSPSPYEMSRIFQFLRARQEVAAFTRDNDTSMTTIWEMSLSDDLSADKVVKMQIQQLSDDNVDMRCRKTIENIHQATASLVRVQQSTLLPKIACGVTYIHRTVKDYLAEALVWGRVLSFAPDANPHLAHLRSVVLSFKLNTEKPRRSRTVLTWWPRIVLAMTHARYIPASCEDTSTLLDTFNDRLKWHYFPVRDPDPRIDNWARSCFGSFEERGRTPYEETFLALAVKFGVVDYVKRHLHLGRYKEPKHGAGKSILLWSTMYLLNRQSSLYPLSNLEIVEVLLEYGLNPNHQVEHIAALGQTIKKGKSPWVETLECVQQGQRRGWIDAKEQNMNRWAGILRAFLRYGADPQVEVCMTYKDKRESAIALIERVREAHPCKALDEVCQDFRVRLEKVKSKPEGLDLANLKLQ